MDLKLNILPKSNLDFKANFSQLLSSIHANHQIRRKYVYSIDIIFKIANIYDEIRLNNVLSMSFYSSSIRSTLFYAALLHTSLILIHCIFHCYKFFNQVFGQSAFTLLHYSAPSKAITTA